MSAVMEAREPSAKYLSTLQPPLVQQFDLLTTAPGGVVRLRELILTLAVQGKLVPQDPTDEPASELLKRIRVEKDRLIAEGKIKRDKPPTAIAEDEKPHRLPLGWEWSNLSTIGVINPRNDASDETIASFVQMSSIPVAFSEQHFAEPRPWRDIKSGFTQFAEGDVGVAKITPCFENGKSTVFRNLSNGVGAGTTELHIVRPLGGVKPEYVLLFLKTPAFLKNGEAVMTGSAGQKRMPRAYFENTPFPLPPLAEQSRIVTRVEELMRLCDALETQGQLEAAQHAQLVQTLLGALTASTTPEELADNWQRVATNFDRLLDRPEAIDALEQTIMQLAVRGLLVPQDTATTQRNHGESGPHDICTEKIGAGELPFDVPQNWRWVRLGSIAELINGDRGTNYPNKAEYVSAGLPFINTGHIEPDGTLSNATMNFLTRAKFDSLRSGKTKPGDLVYCLRGATLGKTAVVDYPEGAIASSLVIIRPNEVLDRRYAYLYLTSPLGRSLIRRFDNGSAQPNLSAASVRKYVVPLPPSEEQRRIVARVESLRRLCADLRQRLAARQTTQAHLAEALIDEVA